MRKIKQICARTREDTKVPSNQNACQKLKTERSGDLMKGRSLKCCRYQVSGDRHALLCNHLGHPTLVTLHIISSKPGDTTC